MRRSWFAGLVSLVAFGGGQTRAQTIPSVTAPEPTPTVSVLATLSAGTESPELAALRAFEESAFRATTDAPVATALPDALVGATLPDLEVRFDDAVLQYLAYFRDDPRGRELLRAWVRRAGRYDGMIRATMRAEGAPEDLRCVALAESGFDPTVRSPVGAAGLFQFMPETGRQYGLELDAYVDERHDPVASTRAAARYLVHLRRRFGAWELALAAYNMGYGALLRAIRKYNTNDYATLARVEAGLPFETTVYVAKIAACGIALRNPTRFGLDDVTPDAPLESTTVDVPGGVSLAQAASLVGLEAAEFARHNPHLRRGIVPPTVAHYPVRVPALAADALRTALASIDRPVVARLRFGDTLAHLAERHGTEVAALRALNGFASDEHVPIPTTLVVPRPASPRTPDRAVPVAVYDESAAAEGTRRVYYRVAEGDDLSRIAAFFRTQESTLVATHQLDPRAALQAGMVLRIDAGRGAALDDAYLVPDHEVQVLVAGTDAFFDHHERLRGRVRIRYRVQTGDTLGGLAARFGLTLGDLARINRLGRAGRIRAGQTLIVYTSPDLAPRVGEAAPLTEGTASSAPRTPEDSVR